MNNYSLIFLLCLAGFANAYFLHWQYNRLLRLNKKIFCLIGEDCAKVVASKYGTTLGVKNEIWGMGYYALVSCLSLIYLLVELPFLKPMVFTLSLIAAGFSLYLLYVQTKILHHFCFWCLIAISINLLIFGSSASLLL